MVGVLRSATCPAPPGRRRRRTVLRAVAALLAATTPGLASLAPSAAAAAADPPLPDADPFYVEPASLTTKAPGTILRVRQVDASIGTIPVESLGAAAYQLLYRTGDAAGRPIVNVTTLIVPSGAAPSGGRRILSLQSAEDSLTTNCAPSYQLRIGQRDQPTLTLELGAAAQAFLAQGVVVAVPDPYGPRSEFLVRGVEGRVVLDGLRAAESFPAAQLAGARAPAVLVGYSGGGNETAAAAELQREYAPELNVVGAAAGGVPTASRAFFDAVDGKLTNITLATLVALQRGDPALDWLSLLNDAGRAASDAAARGPACVSPVVSGAVPLRDLTSVPAPLDVPRIARAVSANALGAAVPTTPTYLYASQRDEIIPLDDVDALAMRYCAGGTTLLYDRDPVLYTGSTDHLAAALGAFFPRAVAYLADRLNGRAAPNGCPVATVPTVPAPVTPMPPPATTPTPTAPTPAPAPTRPSCVERRRLTLHPAIPPGLRVRAIRVTINGHVVATVRRRVRVLHVGVPAGRRTELRVATRISGTSHRRFRTITVRQTLRRCAPH